MQLKRSGSKLFTISSVSIMRDVIIVIEQRLLMYGTKTYLFDPYFSNSNIGINKRQPLAKSSATFKVGQQLPSRKSASFSKSKVWQWFLLIIHCENETSLYAKTCLWSATFPVWSALYKNNDTCVASIIARPKIIIPSVLFQTKVNNAMAKSKSKNKKHVADKVRAKKKEMEKKINPFEVKINRQKHQVLGKRVAKSDKGMPGVSRSKAIKKVVIALNNLFPIRQSDTVINIK